MSHAAPSPEQPPQPSPWRWWICILLLLASTLNYMDRMALNQTAKRIKEAFDITNEQYGQLESIFSLAFAIGTLTTGFIVDKVGVRWIYPIVVLGWSIAGFMTGYAQSFAALFTYRMMLGLFEAGNWPCGIRTTRQVMPPSERSLGNAFFQNGTAIGAVITPFVVLTSIHWAGADNPDAWRVPFRIIGLLGLVWVALWVFTVPTHALKSVAPDDKPGSDSTPFTAIFADHRFWLLIAVIIGVNVSWHTFRVWLPLFLQEGRGYTEKEMSYFMMGYYLAADVGAWTIGFLTVFLTYRGFTVHSSRVIAFALCALMLFVGLAVPFLDRGPLLTVAILAYGFAALGLFPTYFALSQDLSARHQGKVTGTLGCINALFLFVMFPLQGRAVDLRKDMDAVTTFADWGQYGPVMASAGFPALFALILVLLFWKVPRESKG